MKKLLLASTALLGFVAAATPAAAEINLDLGGHFRGYGVYNDNDGANLQDFDFRRDTEVHFTGEATSDNGLTVGAHYEGFVGGDIATDEAYAYFSGNWGRVNFGSEDGAAYLLQVAAPSADSNVDGLRVAVQNVNANGAGLISAQSYQGIAGLANSLTNSPAFGGSYTGTFTDRFSSSVGGVGSRLLDYDHADFQDTERLTYLTPKYMGFQAGISYAPEAGQKVIGNGLAAADSDNDAGEYDSLWELAARWDGEFQGFGISTGGGYSHGSLENGTPGALVIAGDDNGTLINAEVTSLTNAMTDDLDTWNAGLNVAFQGFSVGGAYLRSETAFGATGNFDDDVATADTTVTRDLEADTWVIGAAWDNGPYHVGVSYLDQEIDHGTDNFEADKTTIGAGYTYGPGMSFRGAVAFGSVEETVGADTDEDFTQVTVGTDIQF
jgi:outer membrane protein OmpU